MSYTKLLQATLTISMVLGFYIFYCNRIKQERIDAFIQEKYKLWESRNFDLNQLVLDEVKRLESIDSCELYSPDDRRGQFRLRLLLKKVVALTTMFNTEIHSSYKLNQNQSCIELTVQDINYYITAKYSIKKRNLRNFFSRKKTKKFNYNLIYKSSNIYEGDNLFLVMKMLVRSLLQEIGPDALFRQDALVPTAGSAPARQPGV